MKHVIVLAGGSGTRLWPASTQARPKQFLEIDGVSLMQRTLERAGALSGDGLILIVTHESQAEAVGQECRKTPAVADRCVILPEPVGRNTAPALAYAARYLQDHGHGGDMAVELSADHLIEPISSFREDMEKVWALAAEGYVVVIGVPPNGPATGYGYIHAGAVHEPGRLVAAFKEKPDRATAEGFLSEGGYYWNSGLYAFRVDTFLAELAAHCPEVAAAFGNLAPSEPTARAGGVPAVATTDAVRAAYEATPAVSVDNAVAEKSRKVAMIQASFRWSDVGSWDELAATPSAGDEPVVSVESDGNFVHADLPVALCGVEDLIVVVKNGVVLVCRRGESQLVRRAVTELGERGLTRFL
jgi:mannose-1-phosphate guanylyltransferase/mannose-6-phosphate isomerase